MYVRCDIFPYKVMANYMKMYGFAAPLPPPHPRWPPTWFPMWFVVVTQISHKRRGISLEKRAEQNFENYARASAGVYVMVFVR
jgi:hypothetical protein